MDCWRYLSSTQWSTWSQIAQPSARLLETWYDMVPTGLINVTVQSADVMILPVFSEVLKCLLAWESLRARAEVYLPLCIFKTGSASHCPFHGVVGQASLWFCCFFIAAEMMVLLVLRYGTQGLFPFLGDCQHGKFSYSMPLQWYRIPMQEFPLFTALEGWNSFWQKVK